MDFLTFNFQNFASAFIVLFAILDVAGSLPIFLDLSEKNKEFSPVKATIISFITLLIFFFVGEGILNLFGVDVSSFAVAGALVIFVIACEMTFGWELFKVDSMGGSATLVPIVFPLLAGPGSFTTLLSLKAEYSSVDIILALVANMLIVYVVLRNVKPVAKLLGKGGVYVFRKFFGIILLAIAVKLFMGNITTLIEFRV
ncbi:MAG: MarC family protein [Candidatus Symbiothrix sp.]|jgi:multiple antibiotic resistance protein|nr:MarC family protein [Candidatus Symbiothrix sp.]